jgi:Flp pilus assembly protein TadD
METTGNKNSVSPPFANGIPEDTQTDKPASSNLISRPANKELWIVLGIYLLAVCVRLLYLYESSTFPTFEALSLDSVSYDRLGRQLLDGGGITDKFFWQPLFYPLFLAALYSLIDASVVCVKFVQVLLGGFTCIMTYFLGKRIFGKRAGIVAAVMLSLYGPLIFFECELLATGWAAFWSVALILLFLRAIDTDKLTIYFILGACGALSIITRPTFLPFFIAGCVWLVLNLYRTSRKRGFLVLKPVTILAGFAVIAIPVSVQRYNLTGHFGFLSSSGGLNFYIGNNPNPDETVTIRPGPDWEHLTRMPERHGIGLDMWKGQEFFYKRVRNYILTEPLDFVRGLLRKALQFVSSREIPRNIDIYTARKWSPFILKSLVWKVGGFGFPFGVLLPLAAVGLFFRWRQIPGPVTLFVFLYSVSIILVFVSSRYRTPMAPVVCCLAAGGLGEIINRMRSGQDKRWIGVTACVLVIILLATVGGPFGAEKVNYEAEIYYCLGYYAREAEEFSQAIDHYEMCLQLNPNIFAAHNNLAVILRKRGDLEQAVAHYNKALQLEPDYTKTRLNIARALIELGKTGIAIEHLKEALKREPSLIRAKQLLGQALAEAGDLDGAARCYAQLLRTRPNHAGAHNNLAIILMRQGKIDEAIRHFSEVVRIRPDDAMALFSLGKALAKQGQTSLAIEHYRRALSLAESSGQKALAQRISSSLRTYGAPKTGRN